ncbi:hypothetical protein FG05_35014 [Fusarium graminearum]|nr:hypothetical protein FG05_35014 [Fusarium graminearum]
MIKKNCQDNYLTCSCKRLFNAIHDTLFRDGHS